MLVDDDCQFLPLGQELLEYLGYRALGALSGEKALEILRERSGEIDLVIMDLNLPHVDGLQLLQQLKNLSPSVKVIVSSGFFGQEEMDQFARAGVEGIIHKPFRAQQLQAELVRVLGS